MGVSLSDWGTTELGETGLEVVIDVQNTGQMGDFKEPAQPRAGPGESDLPSGGGEQIVARYHLAEAVTVNVVDSGEIDQKFPDSSVGGFLGSLQK